MKSVNKPQQPNNSLSSQEKKTIDRAVKKVVKEYRDTLKALAKT